MIKENEEFIKGLSKSMEDKRRKEHLAILEEEEIQRRKIFGEKLRQLREAKGFTKTYVAKELDISISAYIFYENGERDPNIRNLKKIANIFEVSIDYLLNNDIKLIDKLEHARYFWNSLGAKIVTETYNHEYELYRAENEGVFENVDVNELKDIPPEGKIEICFSDTIAYADWYEEYKEIDGQDESKMSILKFSDKAALITFTNYVESQIDQKNKNNKKKIGEDLLQRAFMWTLNQNQCITSDLFAPKYQFKELQ